jgi:hypothetical protein
VYFEIIVDGKLRAGSGPMTYRDAERLLVVRDLANARRLTIAVRWDRPEPKYLGGTTGVTWLAPKFHVGGDGS